MTSLRIHGGPDARGVPLHDFSTNSNACGPCPQALLAINAADPTTYPDSSYAVLRAQLAAFHQVDVERIVLAASASEFIFRITSMVAMRGGRSVTLPLHSYGDYAHAATAHGLTVDTAPMDADLCWACEPSSPLGQAYVVGHADWKLASNAVCVLDRAYEPLRLSGFFTHADDLHKLWQLYSPNKALGLTGVRAAYAIAPLNAEADIDAMNQLCPSWPIGAHGVAMLTAWTQTEVQTWLTDSLDKLRQWKVQQTALCASLGWTVLPSLANFFVCRADIDLTALRLYGIKLRDCTSFGLPGHVRMGVLATAAQDALHNAWLQIKGMR